MKTINDLLDKKIELQKKALLKARKPYSRKVERRANSNDFFFDRKTFKIIKKGQIDLL